MALASVARGTSSASASSTGIQVVSTGNFGARSLAVLVIAYDNSGTNGADPYGAGSITDSRGNTWTARHNTLRDPGAASAGTTLRIFTSDQNVASLQTSDTVTVTLATASTSRIAALWEVTSAADAYARYLGTGTGAGGVSTAPSVTTGTINVGEMTIGAVAYEYGQTPATSDTDTTNGSWSTRQNNNAGSTTSGQSLCTQTKVQTTAASTQTYNPTYTTSSDWAAGWISVYEAVAQTVSPSLLDASPALFDPTIAAAGGSQDVSLSLLDAGAALYAPTLAAKSTLSLSLLDASPALYAPTLTAKSTLSLSLLDASPALYAPTLAAKSMLSLSLLDAGSALYAPSLAAKSMLSLSLLDASPALYAPSLAGAAQSVSLPLLDALKVT